MPATKKRKQSVKKTTARTAKPRRTAAKRKTASKRTGGKTAKGLVLEVVRTLEDLPQKIGKKPKARRSPKRKSLMTKVVTQLETLPRKIRKAAKKRTRRA
jgi:hypothetical protein